MYQMDEAVYFKGMSSWLYKGSVQLDDSKWWSCIFKEGEQLGVWRGVEVDVSNGCSWTFQAGMLDVSRACAFAHPGGICRLTFSNNES